MRVCVCFVCVCPNDEAFFFFFFFFNGSRKALVNMGMDAIFMFMRVGGWVGDTSVCLCVSNEGSFNVDEWLCGRTNNAAP